MADTPEARTVFELTTAERDAAVAAFVAAHKEEPDWGSPPDRAWMEGYVARAALREQPAPCVHSWRDFGSLGGRNVSWCGKCDRLAFTGQEDDATPTAPSQREQPAEQEALDDRAKQWRDAALAFERRAMRVEYVIRLLVAAGHVPQGKVDAAFDIAKNYAPATPTAPPPTQPVAYLTRNEDGDPAMLFFDKQEARTYCDEGAEPEPLYAAPPPTEPGEQA